MKTFVVSLLTLFTTVLSAQTSSDHNAKDISSDKLVETGDRYLLGNGVKKDPVEAVKYFRMAVERGNANGKVELGLCYMTGQGLQRDPNQAAMLFREASEQGFAGGMRELGVCYSDGVGVEQNGVEAVKWLRKANGDVKAMVFLGSDYLLGKSVEKNIAEGVIWIHSHPIAPGRELSSL